MKRVRDIVGRDVIDDLWGAGYTILPRNRHPDPFFVPPEMVPATRSYQWWHLVHDKFHFERLPGNSSGWSPVPASRHDGYFMPAGHVGDIEVSGLGLFEKSKVEVDAERAANHTKAQQQVDDWAAKAAANGITGQFKVGGQTQEVGTVERHETKTIETTVALPPDMFMHMPEVFAERDRMYADLVDRWNAGLALTAQQVAIRTEYEAQLKENPGSPLGPSLNALLLPYAIENVRKKLNIPTPTLDKLKAKLKEQPDERSNG